MDGQIEDKHKKKTKILSYPKGVVPSIVHMVFYSFSSNMNTQMVKLFMGTRVSFIESLKDAGAVLYVQRIYIFSIFIEQISRLENNLIVWNEKKKM